MRRIWGLVFLSFMILFIDGLTKAYAHLHIPLMSSLCPFYPYGGIAVFENWFGIDFSIIHVTNTGAAWGFLASFHRLLFVLRVVMVVGLAVYLFFFNQMRERQVPLVLILSGAMGNVLDRVFYGHVVDMFHFTFWGYSFAVFNVADAIIFCGVAFMFLQPCFQSWSKRVFKIDGRDKIAR